MDARCAGVLQLLGKPRNVNGFSLGSNPEEFVRPLQEPIPRVWNQHFSLLKPHLEGQTGSASPKDALIRVSGSTSEDLVFR